MVKYFIGSSALTNYLDGDLNTESDCEGDSSGDNDEAQDNEEEKEEHVRAVLIAGSFSAYGPFLNRFCLGEMTNFPAGNPYSSIAVRMRFCLHPSNPKVQTLA